MSKKINVNPKIARELGLVKFAKNTEIQQVGIDLTIAETVRLNHGEHKAVRLNEVVSVPDDMFALIFSRSTFNRQGVLITATVFEPGWKGIPTVSIYNFSGVDISIAKDTRIVQIIFFKADAASVYNGQYQNQFLDEKR
ncbi:MAG: hypothetical protein DRP18_03590 [Candidatus Aenigmatarchaeota archaeon]|nr:MAG: hypothetical protein DRP18_03590 [Candidatus Aenigmarchaeota archaeon]